jgi:hypothetical protein
MNPEFLTEGLCHMEPSEAENCLRNIAGIVKPGGYLFVSGIDLDVRAKVARDLRWQPVPELIEEIHEGIHPCGETGPARGGDWSLSTPIETIGRCGMQPFSG